MSAPSSRSRSSSLSLHSANTPPPAAAAATSTANSQHISVFARAAAANMQANYSVSAPSPTPSPPLTERTGGQPPRLSWSAHAPTSQSSSNSVDALQSLLDAHPPPQSSPRDPTLPPLAPASVPNSSAMASSSSSSSAAVPSGSQSGGTVYTIRRSSRRGSRVSMDSSPGLGPHNGSSGLSCDVIDLTGDAPASHPSLSSAAASPTPVAPISRINIVLRMGGAREASTTPSSSPSYSSSSSSSSPSVQPSPPSTGSSSGRLTSRRLSASRGGPSHSSSTPPLAAAASSSSSSSFSSPPPADVHMSDALASAPWIDEETAAAIAAADAAAAAEAEAIAAAADAEAMANDEELVRQLLAEEEAAAAAERRRKAEQADQEWLELLRQEATCSSCGQVCEGGEELIPICSEEQQRQGGGQKKVCAHKICVQICLKPYLQGMLEKMEKHAATTTVAATASSPSSPASSGLTEADLLCPAPGCRTQLQQWQLKRALSASDFEKLLSFTFRNALLGQNRAATSGSTGEGGGGSPTSSFLGGGKSGSNSTQSPTGPRYVQCPNKSCQHLFEAVEGQAAPAPSGRKNSSAAASSMEVGLDGQPLSTAALQHRARHRFRCQDCSTIFCGSCSTTPYHEGFDCEGWTAYQTAARCRFCQVKLNKANRAREPRPYAMPTGNSAPAAAASGAVAFVGNLVGSLFGGGAYSSSSSSSSSTFSSSAPSSSPLSDVCTSAECLSKRSLACSIFLPCGHACGGVSGEGAHLPCLKSDCSSHIASGIDVDEDEYCSICYVEGLGQAPTIQLGCSHAFHYQCLKSKLDRRWPGARITFGFLNCPLCKRTMDHPALYEQMRPLLALRSSVRERAVARLSFEGMDRDPAFTEPSGRYYQRKEEYAMDRFAYYMCSKCKQPYFGGRRQCEEAAMAQEGQGEGAGGFNVDELLCGGCTAGSDLHNCAKHGKEYIENKCKFCCNVATWYCWGSTHFCSDCHRRQEQGDYVTRKSAAELPKCGGPGYCPLGIQHPPNGQEFTLGCAICRPRDF